MARANATDRGLYCRPTQQGVPRWYVRIAVDGRMQTFAPHGGFPTKREALTFRDDARTKLRHRTFFPEQFKATSFPLAELLDLDQAHDPDPPVKNRAAYRRFWRAFAGDRNARALPPSLIDDARRALEAKQFQPQTIHHYLAYLRSLLNLAKRDERIDQTPFDRVKLAPVHNLRERFYAPAERRQLYKALRVEWREAAELAGLTGLRWSEQFTLERERVNWKEGFVILPKTKAGRPQVRLLNARARVICRRQLARHTSPWLYPNEHGTGPIDYANFRKRIWLKACTAAGLANARWNDWRHTFASDLTMQGHSDRTVASLMGHTSTQMVKRYAHLAPSHLREAVEGLRGQ